MDVLKGLLVADAVNKELGKQAISQYRAEAKRKKMEPLSVRLARMDQAIGMIVGKLEELMETVAGIEAFLAGEDEDKMMETKEEKPNPDDVLKRLENMGK